MQILHNALLQTRAKILHLVRLTAILAAILNFTQNSAEVIPIFAMDFRNIFLIPNTIQFFEN